ncbi:hypothetical protein HZS61_003075 [Fusarium oxysporum f. sp. conglutinans]|uniref:HTH CENPB-type domain-containing protein n=1 Tax=Fusarium oxysporum f. sp. conglutinans TaxID=100902 RepID=A0A8H6GFR2_FUSOX|nr:hypothetical protein HZS61_003075 [Fusarium oxysporum f. sp. conglutinans]
MEGRANRAGSEGSHGSLHEIIESLDVLFKKLQDAGKFADDHPDVVSTYYSHAIDAARIKLEEYFGLTDATPAYRCAVALHPANKFTYFELEWSHNRQWISGARRVVQEVFAQYEVAAAEADLMDGARQEEEPKEPEEEAVVDNSVTLDPLQQARKRRQRLAVTATSATRGKKRVKLTSELDEFMARTNKADLDVEDPLEWWVRHASDYPILRQEWGLFEDRREKKRSTTQHPTRSPHWWQSRQAARQEQLRLTTDQEDDLERWILRQEKLGHAPTHAQVRTIVRSVLARHGDHAPLGRKWTTRFVERHPALKTKLGRRTDWERVNAATPANIKRLFDVYETVDWIPPERQYNADEGGIMEGQGVNGLVIGSSQESPNAVPVKTATVPFKSNGSDANF